MKSLAARGWPAWTMLLDKSGQSAQSLVCLCRAGECGSYVRIKHDDGTSSGIAGRVLIGLGVSEVVLRENFIERVRSYSFGFAKRFLHSLFAHGVWPVVR